MLSILCLLAAKLTLVQHYALKRRAKGSHLKLKCCTVFGDLSAMKILYMSDQNKKREKKTVELG